MEEPPESCDEPQLPSAGDVLLGKYRIDELLGEGGMGAVYRGRHLGLDQDVAIKVMSREIASQESAVTRFWREARALAQMRSPNVCQVFDVDRTEDGFPFIVMELLEGQTLDAIVKAHPETPISERVQWIIDACEGLAVAHERGVVHRDIKPANLMLVQVGGRAVVKVLDFGVAKRSDDEGELTGDAAVGTLKYMAPEQLISSRAVDARADIWAMAITLYRLLVGLMPFEPSETGAYVQAVMHADPTPLRQVRPDAPEGLERALLWALRRDPDERPATVRAWVEILRPFGHAPEPPTSISVSRFPTAPELPSQVLPRRRSKALLVVAVLTVPAIIAVALVALLFGRTPPAPVAVPPPTPIAALPVVAAPAPEPVQPRPPPPEVAAPAPVPVEPTPVAAPPKPIEKPKPAHPTKPLPKPKPEEPENPDHL